MSRFSGAIRPGRHIGHVLDRDNTEPVCCVFEAYHPGKTDLVARLLNQYFGEKHDEGCTIYDSIVNGDATDGICTCGFGLRYLQATGDRKYLVSEERLDSRRRGTNIVKLEAGDIQRVDSPDEGGEDAPVA